MKISYILGAALMLVLAGGSIYYFRPRNEPDITASQPVESTPEIIDNTEPWPPKPEGLDFQPIAVLRHATLKTSRGDVLLALDGTKAPLTVGNFIYLAENDFYDGTAFHRVIKDFMIQGGDPNSRDYTDRSKHGTGGPSYKFMDEINAVSYELSKRKLVDNVPSSQVNQLSEEAKQMSIQQLYESQGYRYTTKVDSLPLRRGVVAMANSGPNTNGSQFFIITAESTPFLEGKHTPFGIVDDGLDVVSEIAAVETDEQDNPLVPVVIENVIVHSAGLVPGLEAVQ